MKIKYTCKACGKVSEVMVGPMFTCSCGHGSGEIVEPMTERNEVVAGVKLLSAEADEAATAIHKLMPAEMDMERMIGIVGNLCLAFGLTGKELRIFQRGLTEFVDLMDDHIKEQKH